MGEIYRKEQSSLKKSTEAGLNAKRQLVQDAQKQVTLWEEDQTKLQDEIILKKSNLLRLQRELQELESRTAAAATGSKKVQCKSSSLEIATLKHDIVILKKELNVLKSILGDMKRDHNHNFHDMAVKSAISGYDEFVTRYASIEAIIDDNLANIDAHDDEVPEVDEDEDEDDGEAEAPAQEKSPEIQGTSWSCK